MRPALRRTAFVAAAAAALLLAACGRHVASDAPVTWAPADTPYLFANFKPAPAAVLEAWAADNGPALAARIGQLGRMADMVRDDAPSVAAVLDAVQAELTDVHSARDLTKATGLSRSTLFAFYGVGDVPVARIELASPDAFEAFWARVEKRAGVTAPSARLDGQDYRVIGGKDAKLHLLVAVEGKQLVVTFAPAAASPDTLKQLLGLTKPSRNAVDRLARINGDRDYGDYGSGFVDLPRLFANIYDGKDAITREFAGALGVDTGNPACASEFATLAGQVPLASAGFQTYDADHLQGSMDLTLSPALRGVLAGMRQPVAGMDAKPGNAVFDMVLAMPVAKWQGFIRQRAGAILDKPYSCPALQPLNRLARVAADPPFQIPPEAASLLGFRIMLDRWDVGPGIAGRVLAASSDSAGLARRIQQTLPQFAMKTIPTDGTPVAFDLPSRLQGALGGSQAWIAADGHSVVVGAGTGEDTRLAEALKAASGDGSRFWRMHYDGKAWALYANWMGRFAAMAPPATRTELERQAAALKAMGALVRAGDVQMSIDDKGLHVESDITHR